MKIESFMTPRLYAIADCVPFAESLADVGTDHAYIPVYLCLAGRVKRALAMDVRTGPLERAEANIQKFGLEDTIKTRLSDGLAELSDGEADTAVIAGMGGLLIAEILEKAPVTLSNYILQPMTAVAELRAYLEKNGYKILQEKLVQEDNKIYTVMHAKRGEMHISDPVYYLVGEKLIEAKDPLVVSYIDKLLEKYTAAKSSIKLAKDEAVRAKQNEFEAIVCGLERLKEECLTW